MTQYFVPKYRHNLPHINPQILNSMLVEVDERDLPNIVAGWQEMDDARTEAQIKRFFRLNVKEFCAHGTQKHTLEPFLRRPHATLHGGSKPGSAHCAELFHKITFESGRRVATNGFNLWTGGGSAPLMGLMTDGFLAGITECGGPRPDQYVVHVIPAPFAFPDINKLGPRPANEGKSRNADVTIIMPDFSPRRDLLDSRCAVAIRGIGGEGTSDEWGDMLTHAKTGLRNFPLYMLNPFVPSRGKHFYHHYLEQLKEQIECGMDLASITDLFTVCEKPEDIFQSLMPRLEKLGQLPEQAYLRYCEENGTREAPIMPGVPIKKYSPQPII